MSLKQPITGETSWARLYRAHRSKVSRGQTIKPFAHPTGLDSQTRELEVDIKKQLVGLKYE